MQSLLVLMGRLSKYTLLGSIVGVLMVLLANLVVLIAVNSNVYNDIQKVGYSDVALVLGTSRSVNGIVENPFFTHRIKAAAELFFEGKVKHILVSGDNSSMNYNEPRDMRHALIKLGVPDSCITMDFAGLRTLDSVVRSHKIFQQKRITIVSQEFHNYRALFIAQHYGIDAVAYNAAYPKEATLKTVWREYLARPKALLDLYLLDTQPKFLGDKITIRV
ncbi:MULTISPECIES: vancomycin high temperature exclusion protein [unclassified Aureispira]|uniref:SanA/YdcF family protein n=1 Tax=unclassified Aureispira TaxID=2649989 RepID=UPI000B155FB5|nr:MULTISPECIES: ElyC/SanA/YdcF family protein [unclassified Aureispira]WMX16096.1 ElyC/SanA/YdcF family protein [Aureispira sp. CCB-E]